MDRGIEIGLCKRKSKMNSIFLKRLSYMLQLNNETAGEKLPIIIWKLWAIAQYTEKGLQRA